MWLCSENSRSATFMGSKWECRETRCRKSEIFQSVAAKLLYFTKRKRPDIEPEVAYYITRVTNNKVDDWKKMKSCIIFLKKSKDDKRIIGWFNLKELSTWLYTSFAVHQNMRSHTWGAMYMGYGMIHFRSSKQKLNGKSTIESDFFGKN